MDKFRFGLFVALLLMCSFFIVSERINVKLVIPGQPAPVTPITPPETPPGTPPVTPPTTPVVTPPVTPTSTDSVAHWLKKSNEALATISSQSSGLTKTDVEALNALKTPKVTVDSTSAGTSSGDKTITWNGIRESGANSAVSFNKVKLDGKEYQLSVIFVSAGWRTWLGFKPVEVKVDGETVPCNSGYGVLLNASVDHLVLGSPLEREEICKFGVGNSSYALTVQSLSNVSGKYIMRMSSPIIPATCPSVITGDHGLQDPVC